jgi:hypothetical protein
VEHIASYRARSKVEVEAVRRIGRASKLGYEPQKFNDRRACDCSIESNDTGLGNICPGDVPVSGLAHAVRCREPLNTHPIRIDVSPASETPPTGPDDYHPPRTFRNVTTRVHTKRTTHVD